MINIIVAVGENNEIGGQNGLLWRLSSDLKRFKEITTGHPMIMGRKTFESIGRVLPGRTSIVISRSARDEDVDASQQVAAMDGNLVWVDSLEAALETAGGLDDEVFVIGGGQVYEQALPLADRIYLTRVHKSFPEADVFFPEVVGFSAFSPALSGEEDGLRWEYGVIDRIG